MQPLGSQPQAEETTQQGNDCGNASNNSQANSAIVAEPSEEDCPLNISEVASPVAGAPEIGQFESDDELLMFIKKKVPLNTENVANTSETDIVLGTQEMPMTDSDEHETQRARKATINDSTQQLSSMFEMDDDDILNQEPDDEMLNLARGGALTGVAQETENEEDMIEKGYDPDMFDDCGDVSNAHANYNFIARH